jgi:hypothetical protein
MIYLLSLCCSGIIWTGEMFGDVSMDRGNIFQLFLMPLTGEEAVIVQGSVDDRSRRLVSYLKPGMVV